jgi:hypothetical protein
MAENNNGAVVAFIVPSIYKASMISVLPVLQL